MTFGAAVRTCLSKFAVPAGRARRSEYWFFLLFQVMVLVGATVVDGVFGTPRYGDYGIATIFVMVALFLPALAVTVRRLHDCGHSGWWFLASLLPCVGIFVMLYFTTKDSDRFENKYGPPTKYAWPNDGSYPGYAGGPW